MMYSAELIIQNGSYYTHKNEPKMSFEHLSRFIHDYDT